jgi:hypothetical protein
MLLWERIIDNPFMQVNSGKASVGSSEDIYPGIALLSSLMRGENYGGGDILLLVIEAC